ncbi:MAG: S8 family serine peptidase, partial [Anaerolineales bacterium]
MKVKIVIQLLAVLGMLIGILPVHDALAQPIQVEIDPNAPYIPGEVVVVFAPGMTNAQYKAQATALAGQVGAAVTDRYDRFALLSFAPSIDVEAVARALASTGQVVWAQPNYQYWFPEKADSIIGDALMTDGYDAPSIKGGMERLTWDQVSQLARPYRKSSTPVFPNEFPSGRFWGWDRVQADLIWNNTSASPTVCVLDTGVQRTHPDLSGRVVNGYDFVNGDAYSDDDNGHGTHVAGIIAAKLNNGANTAMGISNRSVLAVKVLNAQGYGSSYSVAAGLLYCARNASVGVINMSFGSTAKDKLVWDVMNFAVNPSNLLANGP